MCIKNYVYINNNQVSASQEGKLSIPTSTWKFKEKGLFIKVKPIMINLKVLRNQNKQTAFPKTSNPSQIELATVFNLNGVLKTDGTCT